MERAWRGRDYLGYDENKALAAFARHRTDRKEFLELPPKPANDQFFELDVNDSKFYASLKKNLSKGGKNAYNYVIIAYGSDMENLDFAEKICEKLAEWEIKDRTKVFVKIRNDILSKEVIEPEYQSKEKFIVFGNENKVVYDVRQIIAEKHHFVCLAKKMSNSAVANAITDI